jgi:phasin family protein
MLQRSKGLRAKPNQGNASMTTATVEQFTAATKANVEALTKGGNAAIAGFQELAKAYQALATKNAEKLTASIQALSTVKSPAEFVELQQKLVKEGVESAVADSREIAELTTAVFTAAFEPVKQQVEAVQKAAVKK